MGDNRQDSPAEVQIIYTATHPQAVGGNPPTP